MPAFFVLYNNRGLLTGCGPFPQALWRHNRIRRSNWGKQGKITDQMSLSWRIWSIWRHIRHQEGVKYGKLTLVVTLLTYIVMVSFANFRWDTALRFLVGFHSLPGTLIGQDRFQYSQYIIIIYCQCCKLSSWYTVIT
jgi:hypothetical protein